MVTHPENLERKRTVPEVYAEGLRYFMGEGTINKTLVRLANDLEQRGIDYMVIGAIALLAHGYKRFTEELIKVKHLDADFARNLNPYVRAKYLELETAVRNRQEK